MNFNKNFFSTSNILNNKVFGIIIIALSLLILILRLIFDAPYIALGGDEPIKWIMATELSFYDFSGYENKTEQLHIHHQLRWGFLDFCFLNTKDIWLKYLQLLYVKLSSNYFRNCFIFLSYI